MVFKNAISAISGFHLNEKGIPLQGSLIRKKKQFLFPNLILLSFWFLKNLENCGSCVLVSELQKLGGEGI